MIAITTLVITRHRYTELQLLQAFPQWLPPPAVLDDGRRVYSKTFWVATEQFPTHLEAHLELIGLDQAQGALRVRTSTQKGETYARDTVYGNRKLLNGIR